MSKPESKFHASHHYPNVIVVCHGEDDVFTQWYERESALLPADIASHYSFRPFVYTQRQLDEETLNQVYSHEFGVVLSIGGSQGQLAHHLFPELNSYFPQRILSKWMHLFAGELEECGFQNISDRIHTVFLNYVRNRFTPVISVFTTSFHSHEKIFRVFHSLQRQTLQDWEWVIVDDSISDENFQFLRKEVSAKDYRIRLWRRDFHSGCIGLVKSESAALCRSPYVVEVDHDDELLPDCLEEIYLGFEKFPEVGFVYMTFAECHEGDRRPHQYHSPWALGYGYYRDEEFDGVPYKVGSTPNINDLTVSNIVGMPNHPRAWRKTVLIDKLGNYSECLPVADDHELLTRTFLLTPMLHIDKFAYIQFRNSGGNNFTFIRNREITKFQARVSFLYAAQYRVNELFQEVGVYQRPRFYTDGAATEKALQTEEFVNLLVTGSIKDLAEEEVQAARQNRKLAMEERATTSRTEWLAKWKPVLLFPVERKEAVVGFGAGKEEEEKRPVPPPPPPPSQLIPGLPFPLLPELRRR